MKYEWDYLYDLGYTECELTEFEQDNWSDSIYEMLSDSDMSDQHKEQVRYLLKFFDKADVLCLMARYSDAFYVGSDIFISRMEKIAQIMGDDWAESLWSAYCQDEESIFEAVGFLQETDWNEAVARLSKAC